MESLVLSDAAIIHDGKWYYFTKRGDVFTYTFRGMEGDMMVVLKPFAQKEYKLILKYQGGQGGWTCTTHEMTIALGIFHQPFVVNRAGCRRAEVPTSKFSGV